MKCDKARELFSEHLEGALERPMALALDRHMAECLDCEREYANFQMTWQMLETLPEVAPPPGFASQVMMKVREQREAELATRSWWQRNFGDLLASKVPARAFAAAAAAVVLGIAMFSPVKDHIGAAFGIKKAPTPDKIAVTPWNDQPGMAWLQSGLSFELDSANSRSGWSVFRLLLKPKDTSEEHVSVYVMEPGRPSFDTDDIRRARMIYEGDVTDSGQVVPFVLGQSSDKTGVATALIRWEHRKREFAEAVFVPMRMSNGSKPAKGSVSIERVDLYTALQEISSAFGVVILVNADISKEVSDIQVQNGPVDDALYQVTQSADLRYRRIGGQVYIIERKVQ